MYVCPLGKLKISVNTSKKVPLVPYGFYESDLLEGTQATRSASSPPLQEARHIISTAKGAKSCRTSADKAKIAAEKQKAWDSVSEQCLW